MSKMTVEEEEKIINDYPLHYWIFKANDTNLQEELAGRKPSMQVEGKKNKKKEMKNSSQTPIESKKGTFSKKNVKSKASEDKKSIISKKDRAEKQKPTQPSTVEEHECLNNSDDITNGKMPGNSESETEMNQKLGTSSGSEVDDSEKGENGMEDEEEESEEEKEQSGEVLDDKDESENNLEEQSLEHGWQTEGGPGESSKPLELSVHAVPDGKKNQKNNDNVGAERMAHLIEKKDNHERTPLLLAVTIVATKCVETMIKHNADIFATDRNGFNVYHEAITTKDNAVLSHVIQGMERCRTEKILKYVWSNFDHINGNFYIEIGVKNFHPVWSGYNDSIKIYKRDGMLRIDNTVAESKITSTNKYAKPVPGNRAMIFIKSNDGSEFYDVDVDAKSYSLFTYKAKVKPRKDNSNLMDYPKDDIRNPDRSLQFGTEKLHKMMKHKAKFEIINMDNIRWKPVGKWLSSLITRKQKTQVVNNFDCKLYKIKGAMWTVKSRREHLSKVFKNNSQLVAQMRRNHGVSLFDYFTKRNPKDVGITPKIYESTQDYPITVSMAEYYPIDFKQLVPIFELMAHVKGPLSRLEHLGKAKLPPGFPVQFETDVNLIGFKKTIFKFRNPNAINQATPCVKSSVHPKGAAIDSGIFKPPEDYLKINN